jgi:hypothetical protein
MCERLRVRNIVDRNDFDVPVAECGAKNVSADAPETVDPYFHWHEPSEK